MGGDTKPPDGEPPPPQRRLSKKTAVVKEEVKDLVTPPGPPAMGGSKPYGNMKSELEILPHKEQSEEGASLHTGDREESEDPAVEDKTRSENDDESMGWSGSEPLVFDDVKVEPLTFTEMFEYLRCETAGMDLDKAMEVESVADLIQDLFEQVFLARPRDPLPPTRARYPDLSKGETEKLLHYTEATTTNYDSRKWRARLEGLARSIYKSRRTLSETLSAAEQAVKARPAPVANPWEQRLFPQSTGNDEDIDMNDDKNSKFRFLRSAYSVNEIEEFRKLCETRYGFPSHLREPTTAEKKVIKGILEGSILCAVLPDFLKRVCTNKAYRYIQNTIKAQVEGDLVLQTLKNFRNFKRERD
ncbi:hypothetical protein GN244_ATG15207 [Phytophthora infestans]|uniref:Uncharacterized protein n=1 Tax=Phytophthora infestans TaxID=4787 RepID=A0A833SDJ2_PHYIN|nr:hypothetical protein GN244_ATG15207 [Phytophthora infestans]KAF4129850.1 hypothetical protein GN958_ATG20967 [Phytophthora infestans]